MCFLDAAVAVLLDFILQVTAFVALLTYDLKRTENHRVDCFPWVHTKDVFFIEALPEDGKSSLSPSLPPQARPVVMRVCRVSYFYSRESLTSFWNKIVMSNRNLEFVGIWVLATVLKMCKVFMWSLVMVGNLINPIFVEWWLADERKHFSGKLQRYMKVRLADTHCALLRFVKCKTNSRQRRSREKLVSILSSY